MTAHLAFAKGNEARLVSLRGELLVVHATFSAPPGSRIEGYLNGETEARVRLKVHTCQRAEAGGFLITSRLFDVTRDVRGRLSALAASSQGAT